MAIDLSFLDPKDAARVRVEMARVGLLADFTSSLERTIEDRLVYLREPLFGNPITGRTASSLFAVMEALDYDYRGPWSTLVKVFRRCGGSAVFFRDDLPKSNPRWPTLCVDLERVEGLLLKAQPRKAKGILQDFRENHGLIVS